MVIANGVNYAFVGWENGNSNPVRTLNLSANAVILANYSAVVKTVRFEGVVSAQARAGEKVTIAVTKPDNSVDTLTAQTLADGTYSVAKSYGVGVYSARAHGDADGVYDAWDSDVETFTV